MLQRVDFRRHEGRRGGAQWVELYLVGEVWLERQNSHDDVGDPIGCGALRSSGYRRTMRDSMVELEQGGGSTGPDCT